MARRATKLNELRATYPHVLTLDAGDSLIGDRFEAIQSRGQTSVEAMNRLGYDGMALGLKDLSLGISTLSQRMADARFPFLSANVRRADTGELFAQAFVVRELAGLRIAIVGLTEAGTAEDFIIDDPLETARQALQQARQQADIVILLTHLPVSQAWKLGQRIAGFHVIVAGGNEFLAESTIIGEGTLLVHADVPSAGHAGRNLGFVTLTFDDLGRLAAHTNTIFALSETLYAEDPAIAQWVQEVTAALFPTPAVTPQ